MHCFSPPDGRFAARFGLSAPGTALHVRRCIAAAVLAVIAVCLTGPPAALAQDAQLSDVVITNTRDDLLLYLTVDGAFTDEMSKAILSGVPASFSFLANLYLVRSMWLNKKIASRTITHTIKYDTLKKTFTVTRSWESEPQVTQSFSEARKLMSEVDSLKIVALNSLEKGEQYQIRAKAELSKRTLPLNLHYVLFFMSLWDFETDWYTIDFIY